jgi:hypothetical protein
MSLEHTSKVRVKARRAARPRVDGRNDALPCSAMRFRNHSKYACVVSHGILGHSLLYSAGRSE